MQDTFCYKTGQANQIAAYERTEDNVKNYWTILIAFSLIFAAAAMIVLGRIDKDRR